MSRWNRLIVLAFAVTAAGCGSCGGCEEEATPVVIDEAEDLGVAEEPDLEDEGDAVREMRDALMAAAKNCEVTSRNKLANCQGGERLALRAVVGKHGPAVLPALSNGINNRDLALRRVTAHTMTNFFSRALATAHEDGEEIDPAQARELIEALYDLSPRLDLVLHDAAGVAVEVGTLAGVDEEVRALIEHLDPAKSKAMMWVRANAIKHVMVYGRLRHFELVKQAAASEKGALEVAAFDAAWNMPSWTPAESSEVCAWAATFLPKSKPQWRAKHARLLLRCTDEPDSWRGKLIDEAEARREKGTYARPYSDIVRLVCPSGDTELPRGAGSTCARARAFQEALLADASASADNRAYAMSVLSMHWRDERTRDLIRGYLQSSDKKLAQRARRALKRVERTLNPPDLEAKRLAAEEDMSEEFGDDQTSVDPQPPTPSGEQE